jgi:hypothetical protein
MMHGREKLDPRHSSNEADAQGRATGCGAGGAKDGGGAATAAASAAARRSPVSPSAALTLRLVGMQTYPSNPHDGQTLAPTLDQGRTPYGGHAQALSLPRAGAAGPVGRSRLSGHGVRRRTEVAIAGQRRCLTPTIRRELSRRSER